MTVSKIPASKIVLIMLVISAVSVTSGRFATCTVSVNFFAVSGSVAPGLGKRSFIFTANTVMFDDMRLIIRANFILR